MYGFVATKKDYRMEENPYSIAINIGELLSKYWRLYLSYISHRSMGLSMTVIPLDTSSYPFWNNSSYPVFQAEHESELSFCDF
jgi:hypothetical protein